MSLRGVRRTTWQSRMGDCFAALAMTNSVRGRPRIESGAGSPGLSASLLKGQTCTPPKAQRRVGSVVLSSPNIIQAGKAKRIPTRRVRLAPSSLGGVQKSAEPGKKADRWWVMLGGITRSTGRSVWVVIYRLLASSGCRSITDCQPFWASISTVVRYQNSFEKKSVPRPKPQASGERRSRHCEKDGKCRTTRQSQIRDCFAALAMT